MIESALPPPPAPARPTPAHALGPLSSGTTWTDQEGAVFPHFAHPTGDLASATEA